MLSGCVVLNKLRRNPPRREITLIDSCQTVPQYEPSRKYLLVDYNTYCYSIENKSVRYKSGMVKKWLRSCCDCKICVYKFNFLLLERQNTVIIVDADLDWGIGILLAL